MNKDSPRLNSEHSESSKEDSLGDLTFEGTLDQNYESPERAQLINLFQKVNRPVHILPADV